MALIEVRSSQISGIGYDALSKKMQIQFKTGSIYEYSNVDKKTFENFLNSESKGKFFASEIKNDVDKYLFEKIRPSDREIEKRKKEGLEWNFSLKQFLPLEA